MDTIGCNIKEYRVQNGLSQQHLADYLNCSREILSYYETGARKPNLEHLMKLSDVFGIELDDLINESDEIRKENLALAFRKDGISAESLEQMASFKRIIKNYMKMNRLAGEYGLQD